MIHSLFSMCWGHQWTKDSYFILWKLISNAHHSAHFKKKTHSIDVISYQQPRSHVNHWIVVLLHFCTNILVWHFSCYHPSQAQIYSQKHHRHVLLFKSKSCVILGKDKISNMTRGLKKENSEPPTELYPLNYENSLKATSFQLVYIWQVISL